MGSEAFHRLTFPIGGTRDSLRWVLPEGVPYAYQEEWTPGFGALTLEVATPLVAIGRGRLILSTLTPQSPSPSWLPFILWFPPGSSLSTLDEAATLGVLDLRMVEAGRPCSVNHRVFCRRKTCPEQGPALVLEWMIESVNMQRRGMAAAPSVCPACGDLLSLTVVEYLTPIRGV